jgi:hypothetical protein
VNTYSCPCFALLCFAFIAFKFRVKPTQSLHTTAQGAGGGGGPGSLWGDAARKPRIHFAFKLSQQGWQLRQ